MKVLFVCTGNSCRSVMAEYLFNKTASDRRLGWQARSCGTAAQPRFPIPGGVKRALASRGIPEVKHVPTLVSPAIIEWADVILPMAKAHLEALAAMHPKAVSKIRLFLDYAGLGAKDVQDPIGKPDAVYEECCRLIEQGIQGLVNKNAHSTRSAGS